MKKYNKHHFSNKKIELLNKLIIIMIILVLISSLFWYFKPNLYFTNKYDWYMHMGNKHYENHAHITDRKGNMALKYTEKAIKLDPKRPEAYVLKVK